jgi:hypothetical protein
MLARIPTGVLTSALVPVGGTEGRQNAFEYRPPEITRPIDVSLEKQLRRLEPARSMKIRRTGNAVFTIAS